MDYQDLEIIQGTDNMSGTTIEAWAIPYMDVFRMPDYENIINHMSDLATIYGDVIPRPYKTFYKIHATSDTGVIKNNKVEGKESTLYESIYEFWFPKNDKNALGFMRLSGAKFVFIVQEADGNKRIFGIKPGSPAIIPSISASSGQRSSGEKGATFKVQSFQNGPAPRYNGLFNLDRDSLDLSLYPMIFTEKKVYEYDANGFPLVIDFYLDNLKVFTWNQEWNGPVLARRTITVHIKN